MAEYIDREALLSEIDDAMDADGMGFVVGSTIKRYLKRQPTADVVEAVHGRWIENTAPSMDTYYTCSVCNEDFCTLDGTTPENNLYHYCPNCGAKMGGGADNG